MEWSKQFKELLIDACNKNISKQIMGISLPFRIIFFGQATGTQKTFFVKKWYFDVTQYYRPFSFQMQ